MRIYSLPIDVTKVLSSLVSKSNTEVEIQPFADSGLWLFNVSTTKGLMNVSSRSVIVYPK